MKQNKKGPLEYITFDTIENTNIVNHCFSTRRGGVSSGVYESMNLRQKSNDKRENVMKNFEILSRGVGIDYKNIVLPMQSHTTNVACVTEKDRGRGLMGQKQALKDTDAMITNCKNVALAVFGADCVPVFFVDKEKKAIGVCHAGWRGTVNSIVSKVIESMTYHYGTKPENVSAAIGPSIGPCCFQVEEPVVFKFYNNLKFAHEVVQKDTEKGKFKIDLWQTNKRLMIEMGVKEENIEIAHVCTKCNTALFFSHRAMGEDRGVMAGLLELKK